MNEDTIVDILAILFMGIFFLFAGVSFLVLFMKKINVFYPKDTKVTSLYTALFSYKGALYYQLFISIFFIIAGIGMLLFSIYKLALF